MPLSETIPFLLDCMYSLLGLDPTWSNPRKEGSFSIGQVGRQLVPLNETIPLFLDCIQYREDSSLLVLDPSW